MGKSKEKTKLMKITNFLVTLLIAVVTIVSVSAVSGSPAIDPQPVNEPILSRHESAPVMTSLAAMYAPAEDKAHWIDLVCTGMTAGGCAFFTDNLADAMWESQADHDGSSAGYIADDVTVIDDTKQVWKASLIVFDHKDECTSEVFLLVQRGTDGFWYLDRVLHGPGI
jgi:hypothetical protein